MRDIRIIEDEAEKKNMEIYNAITSGKSLVQKFYDNSVVFLTGGSGFLGKHLIEKLLRSNVKKIYILIRSKKGKTAQQRLNKILEDPIYEVHHKDPNFVSKLVPIEGDAGEENLGIDNNNWSQLADEVNIILHAAATTNFRESFKNATLINIRGAREILKLAKACKHIKSVVYVSTAYANATYSRVNGEVNEEFYESPILPDTLIQLAENMDGDKLNSMIEPISQDWPNSYTFTKAVAEELVRKQGQDLPVCIVRPAIVIGAYREPTLGWVDVNNAYGPSGKKIKVPRAKPLAEASYKYLYECNTGLLASTHKIVLGVGLGLIHTLIRKQEKNIDYVPVDIVNNTIIAAAWETFNRYKEEDKKTIVYTVTGTRDPLTFRKFYNVLHNDSRKIVTEKSIWYCFLYGTEYKILYLLLTWLLHYIPGMIIDGFCRLVGRKERFSKVYSLVNSLSSIFTYFLTNSWIFGDNNTVNLYNKLSDTDRLIYNCDMSTVDMEELVFVWCYGVRKYIIKDDMKTIEYGVRKQFWLKIAHYIIFPLYLYALFKLGYMFCSFLLFLFLFIYNITIM